MVRLTMLALVLSGSFMTPAAGQPSSQEAAASRTVKIPDSFPIVWMRGFVLADDPKGAIVIEGDKKDGPGTIFTHINDQPVTGPADLIRKVNSADLATLSITSEKTTLTNEPFYFDAWAEALRYSDVPDGVRIDASAYPDEQGKYLAAINGVEMHSAAQVRAMLLDLVNEKLSYRSRSTRVATPAQKDAWTNFPSSVTPPPDAAVLARWGALAQLAGKRWYCAVSEPNNWIKRQCAAYGEGNGGGLTQARMTAARWLIPNQVMELTVKQSGVSWTDRIERMPDGRLHMTTSGLSAFTDLIGTVRPDGIVYFRLGTNAKWKGYNATVNFLSFEPLGLKVEAYIKNSDTVEFPSSQFDSAFCQMEEYDDVKAPRMARNLVFIREQERQTEAARQSAREYGAQLEAELAQMTANMRASAFAEFAKIPGVIAETNRREQELDQLRLAAEEETRRRQQAAAVGANGGGRLGYSNQPGSSQAGNGSGAPAPSVGMGGGTVAASQSPGDRLSRKSVRVYFWTGTTPRPTDTHNTHCQSTVFTITLDWSERGSGNAGRAQAILDPMLPTFVERCSRYAQVTPGSATYFVEGITNPVLTPDPVRDGDIQVRMP